MAAPGVNSQGSSLSPPVDPSVAPVVSSPVDALVAELDPPVEPGPVVDSPPLPSPVLASTDSVPPAASVPNPPEELEPPEPGVPSAPHAAASVAPRRTHRFVVDRTDTYVSRSVTSLPRDETRELTSLD